MTIPLVFFYHRLNCYSFNALAGALDASPDLSDLQVDIALTAGQLRALASAGVSRNGLAVAALSLLTCQSEEAANIIRQLREDCGDNVVIMAGGPHATARPEEILGAGADIVFRGESEITFPATLRCGNSA